jgi:hypothetical protein
VDIPVQRTETFYLPPPHLPATAWDQVPPAERVARWYEHRVQRRIRLPVGHLIGQHLYARINAGRWVADCPCASAQVVTPADPRFACVECGYGWAALVFPDDVAEAEQAVASRRPDPTRHRGGLTVPLATPRTWVVGEVVSAAQLNAEIRDQFNALLAAWTNYTPSWGAATTNPSIGDGTLAGRYQKIGRTVTFQINMTSGPTTTYGSGSYNWSLPVASAASAQMSVAWGRFGHDSAIWAVAGQIAAADDRVRFFGAAGSGTVGPGAPATWDANDTFRITGVYEAAS